MNLITRFLQRTFLVLLAVVRGERAKAVIAQLKGREREQVDPLKFDQLLKACDQTLFYEWDGHFTPQGHRVVLDALLQDSAFLSFSKLR